MCVYLSVQSQRWSCPPAPDHVVSPHSTCTDSISSCTSPLSLPQSPTGANIFPVSIIHIYILYTLHNTLHPADYMPFYTLYTMHPSIYYTPLYALHPTIHYIPYYTIHYIYLAIYCTSYHILL